MGQIISAHNTKLLKEGHVDPPCNCQKNKVCPGPLPNECRKKNIIYKATVTTTTTTGDPEVQTYTGMTSTTWKERYKNHEKSFNHEDYAHETSLSTYIWDLKKRKTDFSIDWEIVDRAPPFNPLTRVCALCTLEEYYILYRPTQATINKNDEVYKPCPHKHKQLLQNS